MPVTRTPGFCALCKSRCGSVMVTENGRLIAQEPNPAHPTGAALCIKGKAAPEIVYRPERQLHPMMRTRPKGDPDPGWKRISWDEALDRSAAALDKIRGESGPEAVAFSWTTPSGTPISDDIRWVERFTNAFGSPNIAYGVEVCNWHKDYAHAYTFGRSVASPEFERTGCVVLWGHNPSATWLDHATATGGALGRGAKLVVVDPRRAGFASRADQWLRVRPGSDGALALGLAREMLRNGWFDADFVTRWSNGPLLVRTDTMRFLRAADLANPPDAGDASGDTDLLVAQAANAAAGLVAYSTEKKSYASAEPPALYATLALPLRSGVRVECKSAFTLWRELCEGYPPEVVERLCWVPAGQVGATARLLHESRPVCYYVWTGTGQHTNATQTDRAIAIVMALTGSFDAPGGNVDFAKPAANDVTGGELLSAEQRAKCIELSKSALGPGRNAWITADSLYRAILEAEPYRVRGMVGFGRNFLVNHANVGKGAEAFAKLEFYVHLDLVMSPTAAYADIFLPINTPWEREALRVGFEGTQAAESLVQLRRAAIPSRGESRSDAFVCFELAKRLGLGQLFWSGDITAGMDHVLAPLGLSVAQLRERPEGISVGGETRYRKYEQAGFKTRTGKIEIFSEVFRDAGQPPLPVFVEPAMSPMRGSNHDYPLVLTSAKVVHFCHSQHRDIPSLRRRSPHPEVQMHPDAANERGIEDGAWVDLKTQLGSVRMRAKLDPSLDRRVVWAQYGWWAGNESLGLPALDAFAAEGGNLNRLISDQATDPISGSVGHRSSLCDVSPANPSPGARAWTGWREFRVVSKRTEARDIASFVLQPTDGQDLPDYLGGQHVNLRTGGGTGDAAVRCYSLSGEANGATYRISVKLARGAGSTVGKMSGRLHGLAEGERVELQAPKGHFHLPVTAPAGSRLRPTVLVAGGIGITPVLSMLYHLRSCPPSAPVWLVYGVRSSRDHAFQGEIDALRRTCPQLRVSTFYGTVDDDATDPAAFDHAGRITTGALLAPYDIEAEFYLCGPPSLIETLTEGLAREGVPAHRIHLEAFGPSSGKTAIRDKGPQAVTLLRSEKTLTWTPGRGSLLDQLEKAGATLGSGCRTGQCESCVLRLVEGRVTHPDGSASVANDRCLPCVAIPLSPLVFDA